MGERQPASTITGRPTNMPHQRPIPQHVDRKVQLQLVKTLAIVHPILSKLTQVQHLHVEMKSSSSSKWWIKSGPPSLASTAVSQTIIFTKECTDCEEIMESSQITQTPSFQCAMCLRYG